MPLPPPLLLPFSGKNKERQNLLLVQLESEQGSVSTHVVYIMLVHSEPGEISDEGHWSLLIYVPEEACYHLDEDTFLGSEEYAWHSTSLNPTTRPSTYQKDVQPGGNAVGIL